MKPGDIPLITIERTGCNGPCPVYSAKIFSDGRVVYEGMFWVKATGTHEITMPGAKPDELIAAFEKADYCSLKNSYPASVTCGPSTITSFRCHGRRKRIVNEGPGPQILERLENKIDLLAGLKPLIGQHRLDLSQGDLYEE